MKKRTFLKGLAFAGLGTPLSASSMAQWADKAKPFPSMEGDEEAYWTAIRGGYKLKPEYINLESGYYNILPQPVLENFISQVRSVNFEGAYYMRTAQTANKKNIAAKLAALAGCSPEELIITRNTTESLDMVIGGFPWKAGDEAVMAEQDYGSMLEMFKQVARKQGIKNKLVSLPNHPASDQEIVDLYANAITANTRLLMASHMVNITGQILPIRKICDMAHSRGVEVMVDGAHAFAHIRYRIDDLHCDYYGASLHKWLSTPLGAGILFVKKEHIPKIWPLLADNDGNTIDISRLNHTGTHPVHTDLAIESAIANYEKVGPEKENRLRWLQQYWTSKVRHLPNVVVNTPADPARACGIANVGIKGMKPADLATALLDTYRIYTVAIDRENVQGCRITPNVFTQPAELDTLVAALTALGNRT